MILSWYFPLRPKPLHPISLSLSVCVSVYVSVCFSVSLCVCECHTSTLSRTCSLRIYPSITHSHARTHLHSHALLYIRKRERKYACSLARTQGGREGVEVQMKTEREAEEEYRRIAPLYFSSTADGVRMRHLLPDIYEVGPRFRTQGFRS